LHLQRFVLASLLFSFAAAFAQSETTLQGPSDGNNSLKVIDAVKQKKFEEDSRINDLQIRAEAGSLSRYSAKFTLGYQGPGITELDQPYSPNPDGRSGDYRSNVSGLIGVRYRMTPNDAIYVSGGLKAYAISRTNDPQDITNPGVSYDHTYLISDTIQARSGVMGTVVTTDYYRKLGETNGIQLSQMMKWNIPNSNFILGLELTVANYFFNRDYFAGTGKKGSGDGNATDININTIPSVEYRLTRKLNLNTSIAKGIVHYRRENRADTFSGSNIINQRLGVGYAILHDVYVNPYINFYPEAMSWKNASLAFNTIFSLF
jgi:hypothetical protein